MWRWKLKIRTWKKKLQHTVAINVTINIHRNRVWKGIKRLGMMESNTLVGNAIIRQLQKEILLKRLVPQVLLNTKIFNILVGNAIMKQLKRELLLNTKRQYMKESFTLVLPSINHKGTSWSTPKDSLWRNQTSMRTKLSELQNC